MCPYGRAGSNPVLRTRNYERNYEHGDYGVTVNTQVCGTCNSGSIPGSRPKVQIVSFSFNKQKGNINIMFVKDFLNISKNDAAIAGGKGASLGEMTQAGIPVPPGYVILSSAFEKFLDASDINIEINAILKTVNIDAMHTVEHASEKIQRLILQEKEIPKEIEEEIINAFKKLDTEFVAVRSSATAEDSASAAWAGQLDTFLNTTEETLLQNVRKCWASLFTPRAIFYRFEKELDQTHISVAVVVQKMVNSDSAGIAFSVHPVTEDRNQMIIEAGFGLGEAVVSGQITPDSYVVTKESRKILDKNVISQERGLFRKDGGGNEWQETKNGSEQVLTDDEIFKLSETIVTIENHYGLPQDIEWAKERNEVFITQSRPITTLSDTVDQNPVVANLKGKNWDVDWDADLPHLAISISCNAYFERPKKLFGISANHFFVTFRKGKAVAYLETNDLEHFSTALIEKVDTVEKAEKWAKSFRDIADKATTELSKTNPQDFLNRLDHFTNLFDEYGAWQIATKAVYSVLPHDLDRSIPIILEDARKYSEKFYKELGIFFNIGEHLAEKNDGYSGEDLVSLTLEELQNYLKDGLLPSVDMLRKRWECSGMYLDNKPSTTVLSQSEIEDIEQAWTVHYDGNEIHGTIAYKGKVQGKCRLIKDFKGVSIEEGEILVTVMTDPNYVPLMKKAAAIVTDGGGMLSHAAIVSREMKKPCIIGTKFATQVLKDGDEVEVDADNGVVRILKSSSFRINSDGYHFCGLWKSNLLTNWYWTSWLIPKYAEKINLKIDDGGIFVLSGGNFFVKKSVLESLKIYLEDIIQNKDIDLLKTFRNLSDDIHTRNIAVAKKLSSKKPTKENVKTMAEAGREIQFLWCLGYLLSEVLDDFLIPAAEFVGVDKSDVASLIFSPETPLKDAHKQLHKLKKSLKKNGYWDALLENPEKSIIQIKRNQILLREIENYSQKFGWTAMLNLIGKDPSIEEVIGQIITLPPENNVVSNERGSYSSDFTFLLEVADSVAYLRQTGVEYFSIYSRYATDILKRVAVEINISYEELLSLNLNEIIGALEGVDVNKNIKNRMNNNWAIYTDLDSQDPTVIDDLQDIEELKKLMVPTNDSMAGNLIGQTGHKGCGKGKVRVIISAEDFHKMEKGDVLVTTMTTPDFVPLMQKANAIVTDIGGLLCHASIVSRELGVPCIIGTKFATQVLKDGDEVEVDADNGVVRVLNKK